MDYNGFIPKVVYVVHKRHSFFSAVTWHHHVATLSLLNWSKIYIEKCLQLIRIYKLFQSILEGDGTYLK